jgi:hypothetical protein
MSTYVFFRKDEHGKDMFYRLDLSDDKEAVANAMHNPGTDRVETIMGTKVWPLDEHKQ